MTLQADSLTTLAARMDAPFGYAGVGMSVAQADAAFVESAWYGKILTIPVDDAVREWRAWQGEDDQITALEAEEKRLGVVQVVRSALTVARHQGGAVIVPVGLPGSNASPLRLDAIRQGQVQRFVVLGREEITPGPIDRNPLSPGYGLPEYWTIGADQIRLHSSRVILVNGRVAPGSDLRRPEIWGQPIWSHLWRSVTAADGAAEVIAALMAEAKIDVVSIPGLTDMLMTPKGEEAMMRRWNAVARLKRVGNVLLIDGGPEREGTKAEEWDQKQVTWGGLPETARTLLTVMAGAADIPVTRLTGEQQTGLSGSDAGSLRNYYDQVAARQKLDIEPAIAPLDEILIRSALGARDPDLWYQWRPLWQMDAKQLAEIDKLEAEVAAIYARDALVPVSALETAVQNRMIESGRWPGLQQAIEDAPEDDDVPDEPDDVDVPGDDTVDGGMTADAAPRTLYVRRDVLNGDEIVAWAKAQGFETTLPADDLHVTIAFSRTPIDWMKAGEAWQSKIELSEGGPRVMEQFGEAKVLLFRASELEWRHETIKAAGASWDHAEYQPHITISYGAMPEGVEAYQGRIVLGPEIFEEVKENWQAGIVEE